MNGKNAMDCPTCGRKAQKSGDMQKISEHLERMKSLVMAAEENQERANFYLALVYYLVRELGGEVRVVGSYLDTLGDREDFGVNMQPVSSLVQVGQSDMDLVLSIGESKIVRPS